MRGGDRQVVPQLISETVFSIPIPDLFCPFLDTLEVCGSCVNEEVSTTL